jgi:hypothetical protein
LESGPIARCRRHLWHLCNPASADAPERTQWPLQMLRYHFEEAEFQVMDECIAHTVAVSAQIWARVECIFHAWPWRLLQSCTPRVGWPQADHVLQDFLSEEGCCLDEWCATHGIRRNLQWAPFRTRVLSRTYYLPFLFGASALHGCGGTQWCERLTQNLLTLEFMHGPVFIIEPMHSVCTALSRHHVGAVNVSRL